MLNVILLSDFNKTQKRELVAMIAKIFCQQSTSSNNTFLNNNNDDNDIDNDFNN